MTEGKSGLRHTFPRSHRLRKREEFLRVQDSSVRLEGRFLVVLLAKRPDEGPSRLGIVASKKVGGAVQRNRAKRLLREIFRRHPTVFPVRMDIVIVARPSLVTRSLADVEADLVRLAPAIRRRAADLLASPTDPPAHAELRIAAGVPKRGRSRESD